MESAVRHTGSRAARRFAFLDEAMLQLIEKLRGV